MTIKEWQVKKLYINKAQLEKALAISLDELPTRLFGSQENNNHIEKIKSDELTAKDEEIAHLKAEIENLSKLAIQKDETEQEQKNIMNLRLVISINSQNLIHLLLPFKLEIHNGKTTTPKQTLGNPQRRLKIKLNLIIKR